MRFDLDDNNNIVFNISDTFTPIIELKSNGDIYVKGKLVDNDKEVVDAIREFITDMS